MTDFPIAPIPKPSAHDLAMDAERAEPGGFGEWLKKNPPPDLQDLVAKFGYSKITPQAWALFEAESDEWRHRYRLRNNTPPAPPKG
jgi:hypothetical protein